MKVKVLFFASYREITGKSQIEVDVQPGETLSALTSKIRTNFPNLPESDIMIAVNQEFAKPDYVLKDGDEVALIPPVSGG